MKPPAGFRPSIALMASVFCVMAAAATAAQQADPVLPPTLARPPVLQAAGGCKQAGSCEEAVQMWCGGYSRADADHDGIPCENVCHSLEQVQKIKDALGC